MTLVMFAFILPVLLLFVGLAIDTANWWVHKRHLQIQVDAGAFAGGGVWNLPCSNDAIEAEARLYAGDPTVTPRHNTQLSYPERVKVLLNSKEFFNKGGSNHSDGGRPCETGFIDVKATQQNLPYFFPLAAGLMPAINAHARVAIRKIGGVAGLLPVGVNDVNPEKVRAIFIDETDPDPATRVIGSVELTKRGNQDGLVMWDNADLPLPVLVDSERVGVRIAVGEGSSECGDAYVECYDKKSQNGMMFVRGWSGAGTPTSTSPITRDVRLFSPATGGCNDSYFSVGSATCTIGVRAELDFGGAPPTDTQVRVVLPGGTAKRLTALSATTWETTGDQFFTIDPKVGGPYDLSLEWKVPGKDWTSVGLVQRHFSAHGSYSGPIRRARLWETADATKDAHSFEQSPTTPRNFVVEVGFPPSLELSAQESDAPVHLRVAGEINQSGNESQTHRLNCEPDPSGQPPADDWQEELATGCDPLYKKNSGEVCPNTGSPDGADRLELWSWEQPWPCVAIGTGQQPVKVGQGLNRRMFNDAKPPLTNESCLVAPNNWSSFDESGVGDGDPRLVQLFLTPYGAFMDAGEGTLPVIGFATFYITGWEGNGSEFKNPCQKRNGCSLEVGCDDDAGFGVIVGHFIRYIKVGETVPSSEACTASSNEFEPCTPVLIY